MFKKFLSKWSPTLVGLLGASLLGYSALALSFLHAKTGFGTPADVILAFLIGLTVGATFLFGSFVFTSLVAAIGLKGTISFNKLEDVGLYFTKPRGEWVEGKYARVRAMKLIEKPAQEASGPGEFHKREASPEKYSYFFEVEFQNGTDIGVPYFVGKYFFQHEPPLD